MAKEIVIIDGKAVLQDPVITAEKDKAKNKKPKGMTTKEAIDYLFAYLGININEDIK